MNDFTKEELQFIFNELGVWGNDYEGVDKEKDDLKKKYNP
jgi:hypothetical protein